MTRRLRALWNVGQYTNVSREFQLLEESNKVPGTFEPVDLSGADVTVTLIHDSWGHTAVDELEGEVIDAEEGRAEFTFTAEHLAAHGDHRIQFVVDYGDEEQLVPPHAGDWIVAVGRRAAGADLPLDISELTAAKATIEDLYADHLEVGQATISEVIGDPEISSLSIDELDVDSLAGGIVGDRGPLTRLDGPDLQINENGELEWVDPSEGGFTDGSDHDHSESGSGGDALRPKSLEIGGSETITDVDPNAIDDGTLIGGDYDDEIGSLEDRTSGLSEDGSEYDGQSVRTEYTESEILDGGFVGDEPPEGGLWAHPIPEVVPNWVVEVGDDNLPDDDIQTALDYAHDNNIRFIAIPDIDVSQEGTYDPYDGQWVFGTGQHGGTYLNREDGSSVFGDSNGTNYRVSDLTISTDNEDGNGQYVFEGAEFIRVTSDMHRGGFYVDESYARLHQCETDGTDWRGVWVSGGTTGCYVTDCRIDGTIRVATDGHVVDRNICDETNIDDGNLGENMVR